MLYKVIAKILSLRQQKVLEKVVNVTQGAFVKNRSMAHNILLCQELVLHYTRKHISPRCTLKIDLHKAYDNVHWDFVEEILRGLKFPP